MWFSDSKNNSEYEIFSTFLAYYHISLFPNLQRKATDKGTAKPRPQKGNSASNKTVSGSELDDPIPQRTKRPTKSVNENLEPAFTATVVPED